MKKYLIYSASIICVAVVCVLLLCNYLVALNAKGKIYDNANAIPATQVGMLLGTILTKKLWKMRFF